MTKRIAICIPTYKRQELLSKLLNSIFEQIIPENRDYSATICVCDNDVQRSASNTVALFQQKILPEWIEGIEYFNNIEKGLCKVRNSLVNKAISYNADFILFIDDDEYAGPCWFDEMMKMHEKSNATVCIGMVYPYSETEPSLPIKRYIDRVVPVDGTPKAYLNVGNTLIDIKVFKEWGLEFDMRFNLIGSEDTFLGKQIQKKGGTIINATKAAAYEFIPDARMTLKWQLNRESRTSSTWIMQALLTKDYALVCKIIINMFASLGISIISIPLSLFPNKNQYVSIMRFYHVIGIIKGFIGDPYKEYS